VVLLECDDEARKVVIASDLIDRLAITEEPKEACKYRFVFAVGVRFLQGLNLAEVVANGYVQCGRLG
jgi:hypothetical protein